MGVNACPEERHLLFIELIITQITDVNTVNYVNRTGHSHEYFFDHRP